METCGDWIGAEKKIVFSEDTNPQMFEQDALLKPNGGEYHDVDNP